MNKFAGPKDRSFLDVSAEILQMCKVEPLFKQAINYLRNKCYTESKLKITRLSGAILSIDQCYINLAIVENVRIDIASKGASDQFSPFSFLARQKVETPNEKLQVNLADIFNPRGKPNAPGNPPRRILIRGRAGVGKTTLCKKIVHDFYQSRIWRDLFDCVLWVPLRNLKGRKGSGYNFEKLLFDEFFVYAGNELGQCFSREMDTMRPRKSVLFVLDGWDEVAQLAETDHDMFAFLEELLGLPNVIITSRPSASLPPGVNVHLELETIGFFPEQVDEYIINSHTQYPDEIKSFLQSHQLVQSLARIPIQLDALCHCWKDIKANYGAVKQQTMTSLYQAIQTSLWKKDIPRLRLKSVDGTLIQTSDIRNADQPLIESLVQRQLYFLEHLAFDGLINNVIEFEPKHLNPVNIDSDHPLLLDSVLPHLSFLRTSSLSSEYPDQSFHFIHLTFQEYFAARYFARQWSRGSDLKILMLNREDFQPAKFLAKYKYDQRFNVMWRFAAGLLDVLDDKGEHQATCFLKTIEKEPRDLLGPGHQRLVMHCLSEVVWSGGLEFSTYKNHLEDILAQWLCIETEVSKWPQSWLAAEPEFPEKVLEKWLKQGSPNVRRAIVDALFQRRAPHGALNAVLSCLNDSNVSTSLKRGILDHIEHKNIPLTEDHIRSVATQLGESRYDLWAFAWSILLSQPILSRETTQLIVAAFEKESMSSRPMVLRSMVKNSNLREEAIQLAAAQLEDSPLPQNIDQLIAALAQDQNLNPSEEGISSKAERLPLRRRSSRFLRKGRAGDARSSEITQAIVTISKLRQTALQILREHSAFPIQKVLWLEEQLRACNQIDRILRGKGDSAYRGPNNKALRCIEVLACEVLQNLQTFDLSKDALLLVAEQLKAGDTVVNQRVLQILGNRSDLSKEVLLLLVKHLRHFDPTMANETLQILRDPSNLSKEALHAVVELFTLRIFSDAIQKETAEFLTNQAALPEEVLCLAKAWQEDRDLSRQTGVFCIPEGQLSLSKDTLLLVVSKLRSDKARTRRGAIQCLSRQSALSEDVLHLIAEQLKETDCEMIQAAAEVLRCQAVLPDELLQSIVKQLNDESYYIRAGAVRVIRSRTTLSQELLELIANQLVEQTIETQESALEILADRGTSVLFKSIIQVIEAQLENGVRNSQILESILKILASQSALPTRTLQLIVQQLKGSNIFARQALATFLKHQPVLPVEVLESLGKLISDDERRGQEEAAGILKNYSSLPESVLGLVEKPLYAEKRMSAGTWSKWSEALEILKAQSILSEERQQLILEYLRTRDQFFQHEVVEILFSLPYLDTGVLKTHLLSFYEALLRRSFSEHLVWISQDSGSYLVKDSRHITWNNPVSSERELELVQEVQKILFAEWEMPDEGSAWMALWYPD